MCKLVVMCMIVLLGSTPMSAQTPGGTNRRAVVVWTVAGAGAGACAGYLIGRRQRQDRPAPARTEIAQPVR